MSSRLKLRRSTGKKGLFFFSILSNNRYFQRKNFFISWANGIWRNNFRVWLNLITKEPFSIFTVFGIHLSGYRSFLVSCFVWHWTMFLCLIMKKIAVKFSCSTQISFLQKICWIRFGIFHFTWFYNCASSKQNNVNLTLEDENQESFSFPHVKGSSEKCKFVERVNRKLILDGVFTSYGSNIPVCQMRRLHLVTLYLITLQSFIDLKVYLKGMFY